MRRIVLNDLNEKKKFGKKTRVKNTNICVYARSQRGKKRRNDFTPFEPFGFLFVARPIGTERAGTQQRLGRQRADRANTISTTSFTDNRSAHGPGLSSCVYCIYKIKTVKFYKHETGKRTCIVACFIFRCYRINTQLLYVLYWSGWGKYNKMREKRNATTRLQKSIHITARVVNILRFYYKPRKVVSLKRYFQKYNRESRLNESRGAVLRNVLNYSLSE